MTSVSASGGPGHPIRSLVLDPSIIIGHSHSREHRPFVSTYNTQYVVQTYKHTNIKGSYSSPFVGRKRSLRPKCPSLKWYRSLQSKVATASTDREGEFALRLGPALRNNVPDTQIVT